MEKKKTKKQDEVSSVEEPNCLVGVCGCWDHGRPQGIYLGQDWRYARILGLSMCIGVRIILTQNRSRKARHDLPHPACTFVCDTSGSKLRRHRCNESTHVNILLSSAVTMGSTSCKPSQDVSKRSQPITMSTPPPPPKKKKNNNNNKIK